MSQGSKRSRVQRLADSVLPGRTVGGYANLIEARLRKLAATASTGMLPLSGHGDGAIFFRGGQVVYAESTRTPTPVRRSGGLAALGLVATEAGPPSNGAELVAVPSLDRLFGMLALTEPTIDAVTELLSSESRYAKFRHAEVVPAGQGRPLAVETLLVRTADGSTPRTLAMTLGRSVFGTTIEIYRLLALGMLVVPGRAQAITSDQPAQRPAEVMSFVRALSNAGGGDA